MFELNTIFIDGPGGYGKTFLFNMILTKVKIRIQN